MRERPLPPVVPSFVPPGRIANLPGRGETFYRHHQGGAPGAPTLLLLHGWTASADLQWATAYEALGERYPFIAIDQRGHGRGIRSEVEFSLEDAADDAAALMRHLGLDQVVVVGYSMGGPVAMLVWNRHPTLVSGLVLCATALSFNANPRDRTSWWMLAALEAFLRSRFSRRLGRRTLRRIARANPELEPLLPWLHSEGMRGDAASLVGAGRALRAYDARPYAGTVTVPVGVMHTTRDQVVREEKQQELILGLGAHVEDVHGDHFCPWSAPRAFARALCDLVDDVVERRQALGSVA